MSDIPPDAIRDDEIQTAIYVRDRDVWRLVNECGYDTLNTDTWYLELRMLGDKFLSHTPFQFTSGEAVTQWRRNGFTGRLAIPRTLFVALKEPHGRRQLFGRITKPA